MGLLNLVTSPQLEAACMTTLRLARESESEPVALGPPEVMESWKRCSLPWSLMEGCIIDGSSPFRLWGCIGISKQRTALRLQGRLVSFA